MNTDELNATMNSVPDKYGKPVKAGDRVYCDGFMYVLETLPATGQLVLRCGRQRLTVQGSDVILVPSGG